MIIIRETREHHFFSDIELFPQRLLVLEVLLSWLIRMKRFIQGYY